MPLPTFSISALSSRLAGSLATPQDLTAIGIFGLGALYVSIFDALVQ